MKRVLLALVFCTASIMAMAAPSPKQVEAALAARDYASAKTMISQVLAEHPTSARGHLLKAYVLAAVDKNKVAALNSLGMAKSLDKKGDVINSPLFGRTVAAIDSIQVAAAPPPVTPLPPRQVAAAPVAPVVAEKSSSSSMWILWTLLIGGVLGLGTWLLLRKKEEPYTPQRPSFTDSDLGSDAGTAYTNPVRPTSAPAYQPPPAPRAAPPTYYSPPTQRPVYQESIHHHYNNNPGYGTPGYGMSTGTAMAAGAGIGVVGAMAIDNAIENAELRGRVREMERRSSSPAPAPAPTVAPVYEQPQADYESERQSFSSSSDSSSNSWSSPPASDSFSSSSSSSSSSDWGSSSSDSSSSSSYDSGSSSSSSSDSW